MDRYRSKMNPVISKELCPEGFGQVRIKVFLDQLDQLVKVLDPIIQTEWIAHIRINNQTVPSENGEANKVIFLHADGDPTDLAPAPRYVFLAADPET